MCHKSSPPGARRGPEEAAAAPAACRQTPSSSTSSARGATRAVRPAPAPQCYDAACRFRSRPVPLAFPAPSVCRRPWTSSSSACGPIRSCSSAPRSAAPCRRTATSTSWSSASRPPDLPAPATTHWSCPATGDDVDIVLRDRGAVQAARRSATSVEAAAVEEGRTLYAREGASLLPTGPEWIGNGVVMVRHTLFEPDKSLDFLAQARERLQVAENPERQAAFRYEMLQASLERSLKVLVSAQGVRVGHTHDLNRLWDQAETSGEPPGAMRDRAALDRFVPVRGPLVLRPSFRRESGSDVGRHPPRRARRPASRRAACSRPRRRDPPRASAVILVR